VVASACNEEIPVNCVGPGAGSGNSGSGANGCEPHSWECTPGHSTSDLECTDFGHVCCTATVLYNGDECLDASTVCLQAADYDGNPQNYGLCGLGCTTDDDCDVWAAALSISPGAVCCSTYLTVHGHCSTSNC
jgi:hypothetical protein